MAAGHSHGPPVEVTPEQRRARRRALTIVLGILIPLGVAALTGMIALWPSQDRIASEAAGFDTSASEMLSGVVVSADLSACEEAPVEGCATVEVEVDGELGELYLPPEVIDHGLREGDRVTVIDLRDLAGAFSDDEAVAAAESEGATPEELAEPVGPEEPFIFVEFDRSVQFGLLAGIYALAVVAVAGWRGFRALIGLGVAFAIMLGFMLPALVAGEPPLLIALIASAVIMYVVLYVAHGFTARTSTALLGTVGGIVITTALGAWMTRWSKLGAVYTEDTALLDSAVRLDPTGLIMCGMVIAGLGVLNDVTITQASAVWELRESSPLLGPRKVFGRAMRIGRDHIASTVYTIAFAYAGSALGTLLLITVMDNSLLESLTMGEIAVEVARTLVGSIGLVLAIPLTTAIATVVSFATRIDTSQQLDAGHHEHPLAEESSEDDSMAPRLRPSASAVERTEPGSTGGLPSRRSLRRRD